MTARGSLEGYLRVVAVVDHAGRTVLEELRGEGALAARRTGERTGPATVHVVGAAGGPLGGDHWRIDILVGPGASLHVRSSAATLALPGRDGDCSLLEIHAQVGPGAHLDFAPEPLVIAARARHANRVRITMSADASLVWREELVCGREAERPGDLTARLDLVHDRKPLLAQELTVGPAAPAWTSAAVVGDARAIGSLLFVGPAGDNAPTAGPIEAGPSVAAVAAELAGPAVLVTALSRDVRAVRGLLDTVISHAADKSGQQVNSA